MLEKHTEAEIREECKRKIESLEFWLRRLIDDALRTKYGGDYINAKNSNGQFIINKKAREGTAEKKAEQPDRFPRLIDAALLEDEIRIICMPDLYKEHFEKPLRDAFGENEKSTPVDTVRTFLNRLINPRNRLYHANAISIHDAERVLAYTSDVIESIKGYYQTNNMNNDFNVPLILKVTDHLGQVFNRSNVNTSVGGIYIDYRIASRPDFHVGDVLKFDVEVDPSFPPTDYETTYYCQKSSAGSLEIFNGSFSIELTEEYIGDSVNLFINVINKKEGKVWSRLDNGVEDKCRVIFRLLPPQG